MKECWNNPQCKCTNQCKCKSNPNIDPMQHEMQEPHQQEETLAERPLTTLYIPKTEYKPPLTQKQAPIDNPPPMFNVAPPPLFT
jgi:hypothetical protein